MRNIPRASRLDLSGALLFVGAAVWTLVAAAADGGNPLPALGVLLTAGAALSLASIAPARPPVAAAVVAGVVLLMALVSVVDIVQREPGGAPLRYANANAALYALGAVAAAVVIVTPGERRLRAVAGVGAAALVAAVLLSGSAAGAILVTVPLLAGLVGWRLPRVAVAVSGAVFVAAVVATTVVAAAGPSTLPRALREPLDAPRLSLWEDGYELMLEHPVTGIGPGRFHLESETAATSRSYSWAHNAFLHEGAEGGIPAYALLLALFTWGFVALWRTTDATPATALAAGGLAMLGVHATLDYVLHFPIVPVAAAAVVGAGRARARVAGPSLTADAVVRRAIKAALLPAGIAGLRGDRDIAILAYHRVGAGEGEIRLDTAVFEAQLAELAETGEVRSLDEAVDGDGGGVVLTLDDGYRDFHDNVVPLLVRYGVPMTLYLATGLVTGRARRGSDGLSWAQLREAVSTGVVTIGSHTHRHVDLGRADRREAREELRRSKRLIEDRLGTACRHFAYPFGVASADAEEEVRRLYDSAALSWGTNRGGRIDRYRLARTPILASDGTVFFRAKVRGLLDHEATVYRLLRRGPWRHGGNDGS